MKKGSLTQDRAKKTLSLLKGVLDYSDFKDVDMVIEVIHFLKDILLCRDCTADYCGSTN